MRTGGKALDFRLTNELCASFSVGKKVLPAAPVLVSRCFWPNESKVTLVQQLMDEERNDGEPQGHVVLSNSVILNLEYRFPSLAEKGFPFGKIIRDGAGIWCFVQISTVHVT